MRDVSIMIIKERLEDAIRILDTRMEFLDQRQRATEAVLATFGVPGSKFSELVDAEHQRVIQMENAAKMEALVKEQEEGRKKKILTLNS